MGSRIFAISDIHVDSRAHAAWIEGLSTEEFVDDILILAGDVSDNVDRMKRTFDCLTSRFSRVFFVPGNHELWVRRRDGGSSLQKLEDVLRLCKSIGITTEPELVQDDAGNKVQIVPLFSWYSEPEQASSDSLYLPKEGEDPTLAMWSDRRFIRDEQEVNDLAAYFLKLNGKRSEATYDSEVISFSHFLPRQELMFSNGPPTKSGGRDPHPSFNFSRVAGSAGLDLQIRTLGSRAHIYGHQHRNRIREIDGVTYISHCLGYPQERELGRILGLDDGPKLVWDGSVVVDEPISTATL
jgi:predicted phosphodiesterase